MLFLIWNQIIIHKKVCNFYYFMSCGENINIKLFLILFVVKIFIKRNLVKIFQ